MSVPPMNAGTSPDALRQEGIRLLQSGNAEAALQLLSQATEANPSDGIAFQYLGIARTKTGAVDGGIAALQEAARLLPLNAGIRLNLGVAQAQAGRPTDARQTLESARELDPTNGRITQMLASLPAPAAPVVTTGDYDIFGDGGPAPARIPLPPNVPSLSALSANPGNVPTLAPPEPAPAYVPDIPSGLSSLPASAISARMLVREPTTSERIMRGLGWGAVCAQWWTLLEIFWDLIVYGLVPGRIDTAHAAILAVVFAVFFGFVGAIIGIIVALIRAEVSTGAVIGIIVGMVMFGLELWLGSGSFFNVVFWFFTGRFVGSNIAARVNAPLDV